MDLRMVKVTSYITEMVFSKFLPISQNFLYTQNLESRRAPWWWLDKTRMSDIWGRKGNAGIISFQKESKLEVWGKKSCHVERLNPVVKKLHYDVPVLMLHTMGDRQVTGWLLCLCSAHAEIPKYCAPYLFEGAMGIKSKIQHSSPGWWLQCLVSCV